MQWTGWDLTIGSWYYGCVRWEDNGYCAHRAGNLLADDEGRTHFQSIDKAKEVLEAYATRYQERWIRQPERCLGGKGDARVRVQGVLGNREGAGEQRGEGDGILIVQIARKGERYERQKCVFDCGRAQEGVCPDP
jgi:hypothetical protein